jgi:hypothetical protein
MQPCFPIVILARLYSDGGAPPKELFYFWPGQVKKQWLDITAYCQMEQGLYLAVKEKRRADF